MTVINHLVKSLLGLLHLFFGVFNLLDQIAHFGLALGTDAFGVDDVEEAAKDATRE